MLQSTISTNDRMAFHVFRMRTRGRETVIAKGTGSAGSGERNNYRVFCEERRRIVDERAKPPYNREYLSKYPAAPSIHRYRYRGKTRRSAACGAGSRRSGNVRQAADSLLADDEFEYRAGGRADTGTGRSIMRFKKMLCLTAAVVTACAGIALQSFAFSENETVVPIYGEDDAASSEPSTENVSSEDASSEDASSEEEAVVTSSSEEEPAPASSVVESSSSETPSAPETSGSGTGMEATEIPHGNSQDNAPSARVSDAESGRFVKARVRSIVEEEALKDSLFPGREKQSVVLEAAVEDGDFEGSVVSVLRALDESAAVYARPVKPGDRVYLTLYHDGTDTVRGVFSDFRRSPAVYWAAVLAAALILVCVPRKAGVKLAAVLILSGALAAVVLVPFPSLLTGALVLAAVSFLASFVFYGIKYRTVAAAVGTILSLGVTGVLAAAGVFLFNLSGISHVDLLKIQLRGGATLDLRTVFLAGVLFAALGAMVMVCNAVSSGVEPRTADEAQRRAAFIRGVRAGARAMAPVAVTLFFVMAAGMIGPAVLLRSGGAGAPRIVSDESVASSLTALIAGLGGLALSVPLTAGISVLLVERRRREDGSLKEFHVMEWANAKEEVVFGRAAERLDQAIRAAAGGAAGDIEPADGGKEPSVFSEEPGIPKSGEDDRRTARAGSQRHSAGKKKHADETREKEL